MGQRRSAEHRDFSPLAAELSHSLLAWWEVHGRKDPALKPWMFTKDGRWPEPHEHLNVLECWIAEAIEARDDNENKRELQQFPEGALFELSTVFFASS